MTLATHFDAMHEYARNVGQEQADSQWILTSYDVWVMNPHYSGPAQPHPEDDQWVYEDECSDEARRYEQLHQEQRDFEACYDDYLDDFPF